MKYKVKTFFQNIEEDSLDNVINDWLEKNRDIEPISITSTEDLNTDRVTTILYREVK